MQDINKKNRSTLLWTFVISLITIPIFIHFGNQQISAEEVQTISNLTLSGDAYYSGGKRSSINLNVTNAQKTLLINLEELECVDKKEILDNFKKGNSIDIRIPTSDVAGFYEASLISSYQKIYGLSKEGREYLQLNCRNSVSKKKTNAAIWASISTAILSMVLALFVSKPVTRQRARRHLEIDPIFLICICWILVLLILRVMQRAAQ